MYHTHSTKSSHKILKRRLLETIFNHWAIASVLCLSLQIIAGIRPALANTDFPTMGTLQLHHDRGDIEAISLDAQLDVTVTGLLAEVTLKQTFKNTSQYWVDGSYLFPLHEDSAIQALKMRIGERIINGRILRKKEAQDTFNKAKEAGQIASLVEQQRPNLFTMQAASIAPGDLIEITLDVMLPVDIKDGKMQLRLPTTLTPRYTGDNRIENKKLDSPFIEQSDSRGPRLTVNATIDSVDASLIESSSHHLSVTNTGISIKSTPMDRDILIQWPMNILNETSSHAYVVTHEGKRYAQIVVEPPARTDLLQVVPRDLVLLVDKSGSMAGVSMEAAREALHFALDGLRPVDTFNIVAFDHDYYPLFPNSRRVDNTSLRMARRYADSLVADGGTEMLDALSFALKRTAVADNHVADHAENPTRLRQVVFMTDGSVGYEDALLTRIKQRLGKSRLFTIGIGPAPNTWFIKKAAEVGRGTSLNIQDSHHVAEAVTNLLSKLETPVLTDIKVQYASGYGETYPSPMPDLYADRPGMWVSQISDEVGEIIITGVQNGERITQTVSIPKAQPETAGEAQELTTDPNALTQTQPELTHGNRIAPAIAIHWARQKVASLLDEQRYAVDEDLHKELITDIALDVGLVTPYTSFVAVDDQQVRPDTVTAKQSPVANLIPAGNTMLNIHLPQGSAGADTWTLLSLLCGLTGLSLLIVARRTRPVPTRAEALA